MRFRADRPLGLAPATTFDYRELARRRLPRQLFDFVDGGAYEEATMRANVADLSEVLLRQVVMRDVSDRDHSVRVLGEHLAMPVILAPVGVGCIYARRAEVQAARAAEAAGIPFIEATLAVCSIEEVARSVANPPWFQLYVMRDRALAEQLMARVHAVGSPVLVLTVDLAAVGARQRDVRNAVVGPSTYRTKARRALDLALQPRWIRDVAVRGRPLTYGNLEDAIVRARSSRLPWKAPAFPRRLDTEFDSNVTWDDIAWVRQNWDRRLVVKGVLDPEDARRAADVGVDGVIVSNHGGRQLDSVPSTVRALPHVVDAVGGQLEVLVDGAFAPDSTSSRWLRSAPAQY